MWEREGKGGGAFSEYVFLWYGVVWGSVRNVLRVIVRSPTIDIFRDLTTKYGMHRTER